MAAKCRSFFLTNKAMAFSNACLVAAATSPSSGQDRGRQCTDLHHNCCKVTSLRAYLCLQSGRSTWRIGEVQMLHSVHVHRQTRCRQMGQLLQSLSGINFKSATMAREANLLFIDGLLAKCEGCFSPWIKSRVILLLLPGSNYERFGICNERPIIRSK
jgi:hypothetical protein